VCSSPSRSSYPPGIARKRRRATPRTRQRTVAAWELATLSRFSSFSERFLTDEQGRPRVVEPFQRQIPAGYFAGARELVAIPPKSGARWKGGAGMRDSSTSQQKEASAPDNTRSQPLSPQVSRGSVRSSPPCRGFGGES
jgi:hypothetical protein